MNFYKSFIFVCLLTSCGGSSTDEPNNINQNPSASFTQSCVKLTCIFNASASSDPDGSILSYHWDFGDGTTENGLMPTHIFTAYGNHQITLVVTDNNSATSSLNSIVELILFKGLLVTGTASKPISDEVLNHPDIDGFLIHQGWKDLEIEKGVFDWTFLDSEIALAIEHNKVVRPALHIGGDDSPSWLYNNSDIVFVLGKDGTNITNVGSMIFAEHTISLDGAVWPFDLSAGKIIEVVGTTNNDGRYRVVSADVNSLTVEELLLMETADDSAIIYDVVPSYWDDIYIQHKADFYNAFLAHISLLGKQAQNTLLSFSIQMVGPNTGDWSFKNSPEHLASYNTAGWLTGNDAQKQAGLDNFTMAIQTLFDNVLPNISDETLAVSAIGPVPNALLPSGLDNNTFTDTILAYVEQNYPQKLLVAKGALNARTYFANPCPALGSSWEKICATANFLQINWSVSSLVSFSANGSHEWDKSNAKATATVLKNAGLSAYEYNARWFEIWHADVDSNQVLGDENLQNELNSAIKEIKNIFTNNNAQVGAPIAIQSPEQFITASVGTKFVLQYIFDYNGEIPSAIEVSKDSVVVGSDLSYVINSPTSDDSGLYEITAKNSAGETTLTTTITFQ